MFEVIDNIKEKKIVVFGTGSAAQKVIKRNQFDIAYFVDNDTNKWGQFFFGKEIINPNVLLTEDTNNLFIVVASSYFGEINDQLTKYGFVNNVHYLNGHDWINHTIEVEEWLNSGKSKLTPHYIKQKHLQKLGSIVGMSILVETGTYLGHMILAMKDKFQKIYTIELDNTLYQRATTLFSEFKHIQVLHGDSGDVIKEVLGKIEVPALFWLDGHYSGLGTAKGTLETPILQELELILAHNSDHVILIDDARLFIGKDDYPTIDLLKSHVWNINPDVNIFVEDDIIHIINKKVGI